MCRKEFNKIIKEDKIGNYLGITSVEKKSLNECEEELSDE